MAIHADYDSEGLTRPAHRPLTEQEREWVSTLLQSNPEWSDVTGGDLWVDGECICGCHTVHLEHSPEPQNPKTQNRDIEHVGEMLLYTEEGKRITVALFARRGTLCVRIPGQ